MTPHELLEQVRALEAELVVEDGRLLVQEWRAPLPGDLREVLRAHKTELLEVLSPTGAETHVSDREVAWRVEAMRPQLPAKGAIPTLVARPDLSPAPGCCTSCGDPLKPGERYRCAPCVGAAWLVLREVKAVD